jgi:hypothetical protein
VQLTDREEKIVDRQSNAMAQALSAKTHIRETLQTTQRVFTMALRWQQMQTKKNLLVRHARAHNRHEMGRS